MNIQHGVLETKSKLLPVNTSATRKLPQHAPTNHSKHACFIFLMYRFACPWELWSTEEVPFGLCFSISTL